jgi:hypothetical protein
LVTGVQTCALPIWQGFACKKRLFGVYCLFAAVFVGLIAFGFVLLPSSCVAGFACWYEVVKGVCAASVVFYEVVCFCCGCAAPMAVRVAC